jgi:hypothetical protein
VAGLSSLTIDCKTRFGDARSFDRMIDGDARSFARMIDGELTTPTCGLMTLICGDVDMKVGISVTLGRAGIGEVIDVEPILT